MRLTELNPAMIFIGSQDTPYAYKLKGMKPEGVTSLFYNEKFEIALLRTDTDEIKKLEIVAVTLSTTTLTIQDAAIEDMHQNKIPATTLSACSNYAPDEADPIP